MTNDKLAEQLAGSVAQEGANFTRRIRADRRSAPPSITGTASVISHTEDDGTDCEDEALDNTGNPPPALPLSPNAMRMAAQIDGYITARDDAEKERDEVQRRLHEANARIEQKESTINSLTSDIAALRTQLEQERNKSMRLFAVVRTMRSASDEIVRMEEEAERAGQ
jgi:hypothetical protein